MTRTPNQLIADSNSHGLRPFGYIVEFSSDKRNTEFGQPYGPWERREVKLERVETGYGADGYKASFSMWDKDSVEAPHITGIARERRMAKPRNGEVVAISLVDPQTGVHGRCIFKGTIRAVHERRSTEGVQWAVEATSDASRLDDLNVTFATNIRSDPLHPSPYFTETGIQVIARMKTVQEIVLDILNFPNAWGRKSYFTPDDIDWGILGTSKRCGLFVPSDVSFNDTPAGQAIAQVLQLAGNYTFVYVPSKGPERDKILIVELNLACNRCGDDWEVPFASTDRLDIVRETPYAYEHNVISDLTQWSSEQTYNQCRITSGPIRFYSGHFIIPERMDNHPGDPAAAMAHVIPDGTLFNTVPEQMARSVNQDGVYYRFTLTGPGKGKDLMVDARKRRQYFVGMPLFPDWNPHEDYLPVLVQIGLVTKDSASTPWPLNKGVTGNGSSWRGLVEWTHMLVGDLVMDGLGTSNLVNHQRVYQAWFAPDKCPACEGSGNVDKVYNNTENEPEVVLMSSGPRAAGQGTSPTLVSSVDFSTFTPKPDDVVYPRVTNYIFDPIKFGAIDPATGKQYPHTGLTPFIPVFDHNNNGGYPLPWKNLCPYCRGVGKMPIHKIRNISNELFSGRNNQQPDKKTGNVEIPTDPDATVTGPETWEQSQDRLTIHEGPLVQLEETMYRGLPEYAKRNMAFSVQDEETATAKASNLSYSPIKKLAHPLKLTKIKKLLPTRCKSASGGISTDVFLAEPDWSTEAYYTTVSMEPSVRYQVEQTLGQVHFDEAVGIGCKRETKGYWQNEKEKAYLLDSHGCLATRSVKSKSNAANRGMAFFRPARAWLTCYYSRDNWYAPLQKDFEGKDILPKRISYTSEDGEQEQYDVRCMVIDGRYSMEILKVNPDSDRDGATEFGTGNRVMQVAISDEGLVVETAFQDMLRYLVPPNPDFTQKELEWNKLGLDNLEAHPPSPTEMITGGAEPLVNYARGRVLRHMASTPGEVQMEIDGFSDEDYKNNPYRFKVFSWRLKDHRPRMLQLGIKKLESSNNLHVSGTLQLQGVIGDISRGLGYVDYPEKGKAAVVRVTWEFSQGLATTLELSRERARQGELPPSADEMQNQILKDLTKLQRAVFLTDGTLKPGLNGSSSRASSTSRESQGSADGTAGQNVLFY
jgi:hypothetical protein